MRKKLNYDVLFTQDDDAFIWTNDLDLIDFLDYDEQHPTVDYFENNQLVARSYRVSKKYLKTLQKNYSEIY